jgi:hypothetical protein
LVDSPAKPLTQTVGRLKGHHMLTEIISGLFGLVGPLSDATQERRAQKDEALRAISVALNETAFYYRHLAAGKKRSSDTEQKISNYWATAAIFIRHYDPPLAQICQYKSEFWIDYDYWTPEMIKDTGIELDNVRDKYRNLLFPKRALLQRNMKSKNNSSNPVVIKKNKKKN